MSEKLLVTSDLHLGRRSSGLPVSTTDASAIETWNRLVDLCLSRDIRAVLVAGDVIDRENMFFESVGPLLSGLNKLTERGVDLFFVAGNHDYDILSDALRQINSPKVHLLGSKGAWERKVLDLNERKLQIFGRSFTSSHLTADPLDGFDEGDVDPTIPSVGIVHGEVDVAGSRYGPIDRNRLLNAPVNAWFVGHIHQPRILREQSPLICYPGSPHAFSSTDQGAHGAWMLELDSDGLADPEHIPVSPIRYEEVEIDISGIQDKQDFRQKVLTTLMDRTGEYGTTLDLVKQLVYDVRLTGSTDDPGKAELWKDEVADYSDRISDQDVQISVRKVTADLSPAIDHLEAWAEQNNPAGVLADILLKLRNEEDTELIGELIDQWQVKSDQLNRADIYRPLRKKKENVASNVAEARSYLRAECERLLMQLIRQQQTKES